MKVYTAKEVAEHSISNVKGFTITPFGLTNSCMSITSNIAKRTNKKTIAKILY